MGKRKTHHQFVNEVFLQVGDEYEVIGNYFGATTKIKIRHNLCTHEYEVRPYSFLQGKRCPNCYGCHKKTHEVFVREVYAIVGNEYIVIDEYVNTATPLEMKHIVCGNSYKVKPNNFLDNGTRCPKCFGNPIRDTEIFKEEVFAQVGNGYSVLGEYSKTIQPILVKHNTCGNTYKVTPNNFLQGQRCPECKNISNGESKITKWLVKNNIPYQTQYKIADCKNIRLLRFDFAIFKDNALFGLVEFDGRQHFEAVDLFGGEESLKETQQRDGIKNEYCFKNEIPMLRIPYWEEKNIEFILKDFLLKQLVND